MIFSHFMRASDSSICLKFSMSLLSSRLSSSRRLAPAGWLSTAVFLFIELRVDEQISQTTLAELFSNVQAGQCQVFGGVGGSCGGITTCCFEACGLLEELVEWLP
jgi:hypothetical protein